MKTIIFLMGIGIFFLISCSSNKKIAKDVNLVPLPQNENYFNSQNAISETVAKEMIAGFPHHKYRGLRSKKKLKDAWAYFDPSDLSAIMSESSVVDSIKFFYGIVLKNQDPKSYKFPTMVLQVKFKTGTTEKGLTVLQPPVYFKTVKICPPPPNCTVTSSN